MSEYMKKIIYYIFLLLFLFSSCVYGQDHKHIRYFVPIVSVDFSQFEVEKSNHKIYYESYEDSIGSHELIRLCENDSIMQKFTYKEKYKKLIPDTWKERIMNKLIELDKSLEITKDKDERKRIQKEIDWLNDRYSLTL